MLTCTMALPLSYLWSRWEDEIGINNSGKPTQEDMHSGIGYLGYVVADSEKCWQ